MPAHIPLISSARQAGFTLVETIVVISLLAIIWAVAAPAFKDVAKTNNAENASSVIVESITAARNKSVEMALPVQLAIDGQALRYRLIAKAPESDSTMDSGVYKLPAGTVIKPPGISVYTALPTGDIWGTPLALTYKDQSVAINTSRQSGRSYVR